MAGSCVELGPEMGKKGRKTGQHRACNAKFAVQKFGQTKILTCLLLRHFSGAPQSDIVDMLRLLSIYVHRNI